MTSYTIPADQEIDLSFNNTVTINNTTANSIRSTGSIYTTNGTGNYVYTTSPTQYYVNSAGSGGGSGLYSSAPSSLNVKGDAEFEGKIKVNGQDLGEFMETISKRLSILVPDPKKLEHFKALQKAYDHYKTLEALCELPEEKNE
jgi:hypothetical protein